MKDLLQALKGRNVLVFLDLEGTQFTQEVIEIGAVKAYLKPDGTIKKKMPGFRILVKAHARVGRLVTDLTGITDEQLKKEGVPYRVALASFKRYVGRDWRRCLFVTYGNNDAAIIKGSEYSNLDAEDADSKAIVRNMWDYEAFVYHYVRDPNGNVYSLANCLKRFGVPFDGQAHDALADAANLLSLYEAILARPDILAQEYAKALGQKNYHLPEALRHAAERLSQGESVSPEEFQEDIRKSLL